MAYHFFLDIYSFYFCFIISHILINITIVFRVKAVEERLYIEVDNSLQSQNLDPSFLLRFFWGIMCDPLERKSTYSSFISIKI